MRPKPSGRGLPELPAGPPSSTTATTTTTTSSITMHPSTGPRVPGQSLRKAVAEAVPAFPDVIVDLVAQYVSSADRIQAHQKMHGLPNYRRPGDFWLQDVPRSTLTSAFRRLHLGDPALHPGALVLCGYERDLAGIMRPGLIVTVWDDGVSVLHAPRAGYHESTVGKPDGDACFYTTRAMAACNLLPPGGTPREELAARGRGTMICWRTEAGLLWEEHLKSVAAHGDEVLTDRGSIPATREVWVHPIYDPYPDWSVELPPRKPDTDSHDQTLPIRKTLAREAESQSSRPKAYTRLFDFTEAPQDQTLWVESPRVDSKGGGIRVKVAARYEGRPFDSDAPWSVVELSFNNKEDVPPRLDFADARPPDKPQPTNGRHRIWLKIPLPKDIAITRRMPEPEAMSGLETKKSHAPPRADPRSELLAALGDTTAGRPKAIEITLPRSLLSPGTPIPKAWCTKYETNDKGTFAHIVVQGGKLGALDELCDAALRTSFPKVLEDELGFSGVNGYRYVLRVA